MSEIAPLVKGAQAVLSAENRDIPADSGGEPVVKLTKAQDGQNEAQDGLSVVEAGMAAETASEASQSLQNPAGDVDVAKLPGGASWTWDRERAEARQNEIARALPKGSLVAKLEARRAQAECSPNVLDVTYAISGSKGVARSVTTGGEVGRRQTRRLDFGETTVVTKDNIIELLPDRPYATDDFEAGMRFWPKTKAVKFKQIQFNHPNLIRCIILDLDRSDAVTAWQDENLPAPNIVMQNPQNGHCHYVWFLKTPVHKFEKSSSKALDYLKAIERGLTRRLRADVRYTGTTAKNPLHPAWRTFWNRSQPYDLKEIDQWLEPDDKRPVAGPKFEFGIGRNCSIFDAVRVRAYGEVRDFKTRVGNVEAWVDHLLAYCVEVNGEFEHGLNDAELKGIAKSIGKWTWQKYGHGVSKRQKARAEKRWAGHVKQEPWKAHGVTKRTWMRWKKAGRPETLEAASETVTATSVRRAA